MVDQDRIALNNRFKKVYRLLEMKGVIVKSHPKKSKSAFAEILLGSKQYGHIITKFLNDERYIDYKHARKLCTEFNVNLSYMLDGIGEPFEEEQPLPRPSHVSDYVGFDDAPAGNILFTTARAFAGWTSNDSSFKDENSYYFSFPGLNGSNLVAFNVEGNSMEPLIESGDMVICRSVEQIKEIKDNEVYAVKHDGQLWLKHVKKLKDDFGRIIKLMLTSANYLDHPPFVEEVDQTTRLYKVVRKVSRI